MEGMAKPGAITGRRPSAGEGAARSVNSDPAGSIAEAVRVYSLEGDSPRSTHAPQAGCVAFQNIGGDPEQEYFADGIVEEIHHWYPDQMAIRNRAQPSFIAKG